jgi:hypothetical protein
MGSTQESLLSGTPLFCIPQINDQFALAERIFDLGAGDYAFFRENSKEKFQEYMRQSLKKMLVSEQRGKFVENSVQVGNMLREAGGSFQAANIIEKLFLKIRKEFSGEQNHRENIVVERGEISGAMEYSENISWWKEESVLFSMIVVTWVSIGVFSVLLIHLIWRLLLRSCFKKNFFKKE